eukprot:CAMPEP_0114147184 /NCGR_PEP_ID=MMETSP0043_2-20121206/20956_1 /TAXON_ID=464988 /ORGANISM="Hemiselmis andersenii, Strain CCMP644" /LENGTH=99 /DNA_ID=CAMNT_0001241675 /DNA_START=210 /DNA_END=506 /DNA_ORIENTATION=+
MAIHPCANPLTANAFQCCAVMQGGRDRFLFHVSRCDGVVEDQGVKDTADLSKFETDDKNINYALRATAGRATSPLSSAGCRRTRTTCRRREQVDAVGGW